MPNALDLDAWLDRYGAAWEGRDPDAVAPLFAEEATYRETPFSPVMRGRAAISAYWTEIPETQREIAFDYDILGWIAERAVVRWTSRYTKIATDEQVTLDGIFLLTFGDDGLCTSLEEWWHIRFEPPV